MSLSIDFVDDKRTGECGANLQGIRVKCRAREPTLTSLRPAASLSSSSSIITRTIVMTTCEGHALQVVTHMTHLLFRNARGFPLVVHGISPASASLEALMTTERWLGTHDPTDDIDCESLADVSQLLLITHLNYKSSRFIFRQGQSLTARILRVNNNYNRF